MGHSRTAWITSLTTGCFVPISTIPSVSRQPLQRDLSERWIAPILFREDGRADRPVDTNVRVGPDNATLGPRVIEVRTLISDQGTLACHTETVREPLRNVELALIAIGEHHTDPQPKRRGADTDIDRNIEDLSLQHIHQLPLGVGGLEVQTAECPPGRERQVVLDKMCRQPKRLVAGLVPRL